MLNSEDERERLARAGPREHILCNPFSFVELANTRIELIAPLGERSPIAGFLDRNPAGRFATMSA